MLTITGECNTAAVMTDYGIDDATRDQILAMCNLKSLEGSHIVIMPDCHAGAGCTIGTTMTIKDAVVPNFVGVDIGCGVLACNIGSDQPDFDMIDRFIRQHIPCGMNVRSSSGRMCEAQTMTLLDSLACRDHISADRALDSVGTLGGGNHFIEIDWSELFGSYILLIHTGSRYLGKQVAEYYQDMACRDCAHHDFSKEIADMKRQGREKEIESWLMEHQTQSVPKAMAHLYGEHMAQYLHDMTLCQIYAEMNRKSIVESILSHANICGSRLFDTVHNYIACEKGGTILRKGAVSANKSRMLVIPMNMRDGTLLCVGRGNQDWNCSAPHGAGRIMSRAEARQKVDMEAFRSSMDGIYTTSVCEGTMDEAPMAYKPMKAITDVIDDTVEIIDVMKPVYNFKASETARR